jgi:riboflavin kinase/FMN adenylyltransferase
MSIIDLAWDAAPDPACRGGALTIGNFDGVHRGHQALVEAARSQAATLPGPAVALTFDPHPSRLLRLDPVPPPLVTLRDRARLLHEAGADHVVVLHIDHQFLHLEAPTFFDRIIVQGFQPRALVEGFNFAFGHDRGGNVETLRALCDTTGRRLIVMPPLEIDGGPVSSSRVRAAIVAGDVREAEALLGRPHQVAGTVATGQKRGRTLGFPTANLEGVEVLLPGDGVYAVRARAQGRVWAGAANVGPNPTFGENARKLEVHLIDFHGDLYGREVTLEFIRRLRDTRPFSGVAELAEQLRRDVEQASRLVRIG